MEQTLDRIKLLMEYNSSLTLTENVDKLLLNEQPQMNRFKSAISVIEKILSRDRGFLRELQRIPIFSSANSVDDINRIISDIRSGRKVLTKKESLDVIKSLSLNNGEFRRSLQNSIIYSKYFDDLAKKVYNRGRDYPPDKTNLEKARKYFEDIGLDPSVVEYELRNSAPKTIIRLRGLEAYREAIKVGLKKQDILNKALNNTFKFFTGRRRKINWDNDSWIRLGNWAISGSNRRFSEIIVDFKRLGLGPFIVSLGAEFARRWLILFIKLTLINMFLLLIKNFITTGVEYPKEDYNQAEIITDICKEAWTTPDYRWIFPFFVTWQALYKFIMAFIDPFIRGGSEKNYWENAIDVLTNQKEGLINEIEENIEQTYNENENDSEQIKSSEKGFKTFLLAKGKKYESGSFLPAEGEYPPFGKDTEGKAYEFIDGKWQ